MNKRFTLWIENDLLRKIENAAKRYALKSSAYIRMAVIEKLEKEVEKKINN